MQYIAVAVNWSFYMVLHLTDGEYNLRPSSIWVACDFYWIYVMEVHFHLNYQQRKVTFLMSCPNWPSINHIDVIGNNLKFMMVCSIIPDNLIQASPKYWLYTYMHDHVLLLIIVFLIYS